MGGARAQGVTAGPPPAPTDSVKTRQVQIVQADSLTGGQVAGEQVRSLIGRVRLRQDATDLHANRATQYLSRDEILFLGDVLIVDEGDTLRADRVLYDRRSKVGRATGAVRLSDGEVIVTSPSGLYFVDEKRTVFEDGVRLVDSVAVLTSRGGEYWSDEKRAEFYGDVRLVEERTMLEADSVTYFRETEVSLARGHVFIERIGEEEEEGDAAPADTTTRTLLFGQWAYNDEQGGLSRVRGNPLLVQLRSDSTGAPADTLIVRALTLESVRQDSLQRLFAVGSVRIRQGDFAARADSVVYDRLDLDSLTVEESRLFGRPITWFEEAQVTADTLRVLMRGGALDSLFAWGNAFTAQRDSVLDRIQQLKGHDLVGHFEEDELRRLVVGPNAEVIQYLRGDDDRPDGAVKASADTMFFFFEDDELRRLDAVGGIEGTQYAERLLPTPFQLDGFRWVPEERPTKADLLQEERARQRLGQPALPPPVVTEAPPVPEDTEVPTDEALLPVVPVAPKPEPEAEPESASAEPDLITSPPGDAAPKETAAPAPPEAGEAQESLGEGWGLVLASETGQAEAEVRAAGYREALQAEAGRVAVVRRVVGGVTRYRVIFGPFATSAEAQAARARLAGRLPPDAWVVGL